MRAENTAYFFEILIPFKFKAFTFGWVVNNTIFCGVTNLEHTFNIDFTWTLRLAGYSRQNRMPKLYRFYTSNISLYFVFGLNK